MGSSKRVETSTITYRNVGREYEIAAHITVYFYILIVRKEEGRLQVDRCRVSLCLVCLKFCRN